MKADKEYVIHLNAFDLGQLIDGLEVRANAWKFTAEYFETGVSTEGFAIEECADAEEARKIEAHYRQILVTLTAQQKQQDGRNET